MSELSMTTNHAVAIVGMSCRVPGANDVDGYWTNLLAGRDSIRHFERDELLAAGVPTDHVDDPMYVPARGVLDDAEWFDPAFFAIAEAEAEVIDPQQRLFLECAWEACEQANVVPREAEGDIGVFGGSALSTYLLEEVIGGRTAPRLDDIAVMLGNDKDFLVGRVAYKLGCRGPAIAVQTACSTSLVAVALAAQSLVEHQCDLALAGGSAIFFPQTSGYFFEAGGIRSVDGRGRAFDDRASGFVRGNGVGIVLLKRFADALADGDHVLAVLRGWAVGNDGAAKAGFTAPSTAGQAQAISSAISFGALDARTIGLVEAHGTGTPLGDPVEVAALTAVFRRTTSDSGFCALGAVKNNLGHLDAAAGVVALIKAALAVKTGVIPPMVNVSRPNPELRLETTPFYINTETVDWTSSVPRRALVNATGLGGTNAAVVVEAPPQSPAPLPWRRPSVVVASGHTAFSAAGNGRRVAAALASTPTDAHAAHRALFRGRLHHTFRYAAGGTTIEEAAEALRSRIDAKPSEARPMRIGFVFPGGGSQYRNMARELYDNSEAFRNAVRLIFLMYKERRGVDLEPIVYPAGDRTRCRVDELRDPRLGLVALFAVEYALARELREWGLVPDIVVGHSVGEYTAAVIAGGLSVEGALTIVDLRGELFSALPPGRLLAARLDEARASSFVDDRISLAAVNGSESLVFAGLSGDIDDLAMRLAAASVETAVVAVDVAAHSWLIDGIRPEFERRFPDDSVAALEIPLVSNVDGSVLAPAARVDVAYWSRHLRATVQFAACVETLSTFCDLLVEVGPTGTLTPRAQGRDIDFVRLLPRVGAAAGDLSAFGAAMAHLWERGAAVLPPVSEHGPGALLPTYAFDRKPLWRAAHGRALVGSAAPPVRQEALVVVPDTDDRVSTDDEQARVDSDLAAVMDVVTSCWEEVLGRAGAKVDSDFFEEGGDSLLAVRLVNRVQRSLDIPVKLRDFLTAPSIDGLARTLASRMGRQP